MKIKLVSLIQLLPLFNWLQNSRSILFRIKSWCCCPSPSEMSPYTYNKAYNYRAIFSHFYPILSPPSFLILLILYLCCSSRKLAFTHFTRLHTLPMLVGYRSLSLCISSHPLDACLNLICNSITCHHALPLTLAYFSLLEL